MADPAFAKHPIENVSWYDAMEYCTFLNESKIPRKDADGFRLFGLPTEAQWEFVARENNGIFPWGDQSYEGRANFNSPGTTPVDMFPLGATRSGVMDMSGNVYEWCADWYANGYKSNDLIDPQGPSEGVFPSKVTRGGAYDYTDPDLLRVVDRNCSDPRCGSDDIGFRLVENF
jgi:formylglycine-generating enzyme required for sulfatase activity